MTATPAPSIDPQPLELRAGALRLALRADLGACIAGLWHGKTPVMRSTEPAALETSRKGAAYPLLPYSNRIGFARFQWQGREHTTRPNFDDSPHSVHGMGWQRPWQIESRGADAAVLTLVHPGDADWPFPFEARQHFTLSADAMHVALVFTNTAETAQPVGLGWHPYFPKRERSRLQIDLTHRWDSDAVGLPARRVVQSGIDSDVAPLDFDNCFDGWHGPALIRDETFSLRLTSSLDHLVVFTPRHRGYFCVEPVSHVSNAIQMTDPVAHGLRSVAPGDSVEASMTLAVALV